MAKSIISRIVAVLFWIPLGVGAGSVQASEKLALEQECMDCHSLEKLATGKRKTGPPFKDISAKYKGKAEAEAMLFEKIKKGGSGNWGSVAMLPNPQVSDADIRTLVKWVLAIEGGGAAGGVKAPAAAPPPASRMLGSGAPTAPATKK
jgi:cytochrome c